MAEIADLILSAFSVPPVLLDERPAPRTHRWSDEERHYISLWERGFFTGSRFFPSMTLPEVLEYFVWGSRLYPRPKEGSDTMTTVDPAEAVRNTMARFSCCEGYRNDGIDRPRAAVNAILGLHTCGPETDSPLCLGCGKPYPCLEVRLIAKAIGVACDG